MNFQSDIRRKRDVDALLFDSCQINNSASNRLRHGTEILFQMTGSDRWPYYPHRDVAKKVLPLSKSR